MNLFYNKEFDEIEVITRDVEVNIPFKQFEKFYLKVKREQKRSKR